MFKKIILCLIFSAIFANAHALKVFGSEENGILHVKAYFTKSSPCKGCKVELLDEKEKVFATALSDELGEIDFPLKKQKFTITALAPMGHKGMSEFTSEYPIKEQSDTQFAIKFILALLSIVAVFVALKLVKRKKS